MGISLHTLLDKYFYKEEIQNALEEIGVSFSGTKDELVDRLVKGWASHNRKNPDLLDFLSKQTLSEFAKDYGLDSSGSRSALVGRINKASLITVTSKVSRPKLASKEDYLFNLPFILSLLLTILLYLLMPILGLSQVAVQVGATILFFLGVWRGLVFLKHRM